MRPGTEKIIAPERQAELFELLGSTVGSKYRLERLLGAGGMGGVFAATPLAGGPQLAVKVLSVSDPSARERIAKRFAREARAVSTLHCPHIVHVVDAGTDGSRPWLAMELLEGEDLGQLIRRQGHIPAADAAHVAAQVLVALAKAHEHGVVHRDLKPDNVFINPRPGDPMFCKLLDFGMSKLLPTEGQTLALALTKKGMAVGTPFYMAPEQARAVEDIDGRADVWALGAILFECLTGRPPYVGPTQQQVLISICTTDAPDVRALRPEVPSPLAKLIKRAMARERNERFLSAWQMLEALVLAFPHEQRLLPVSTRTAVDLAAPGGATPLAVTPVPPTPPISSKTLALGPLPEATGPLPMVTEARPTPAPSKTMQVLALALGALVLGVGVTLCVLALLRR